LNNVNNYLSLYVSANNKNAFNLYQKLNFYEINRFQNGYKDRGYGIYTGEGTTAILMLCNPLSF